jgi:hypothetical protein
LFSKVEDLALIGRTRKGNKKVHNKGKKEELSQGKKYLSNVKCFKCNQNGHYANQCLEKKKGKAKQQKQVSGSAAKLQETCQGGVPCAFLYGNMCGTVLKHISSHTNAFHVWEMRFWAVPSFV